MSYIKVCSYWQRGVATFFYCSSASINLTLRRELLAPASELNLEIVAEFICRELHRITDKTGHLYWISRQTARGPCCVVFWDAQSSHNLQSGGSAAICLSCTKVEHTFLRCAEQSILHDVDCPRAHGHYSQVCGAEFWTVLQRDCRAK